MIFPMWNGAWNKLQFKVCQVVYGSVAYLDKHSTLDPVMVSVVSSNPTGGHFLKIFKPLDVNFGLKCKCDLIVKNSTEFALTRVFEFCIRFIKLDELAEFNWNQSNITVLKTLLCLSTHSLLIGVG